MKISVLLFSFLVSFVGDFEFHLENAFSLSIKAVEESKEKLFKFDCIEIVNVYMSNYQKVKMY